MTYIKKITKIVLVVLFVLANISLKSQEFDSWEKVKADGGGRLSLIYFAAPGIISGPKEQPKGMSLDILKDFTAYIRSKYQKTISIQVVEAEIDFPSFLNRIQNSSNLLGVSAVTITEDRKKKFKFTPPFLACPVVLITNKSSATITSLKDLSKYKSYALSESSQSTVMKQMQKKNWLQDITYFATPKEVLDKVSATPDSFTLLGLNDFLDASRKNLNVKMQKLAIGNLEVLGFIMSRNSDWDSVWEEFLTEQYLDSPEYKKSIARNLGSVFLAVQK